MTRMLLSSLGWMSLAASAFAQAVTVQQPVVNTFSTATTVTVPDRGSMFLGGVNSARSGRVTTGPFRSGSSFGSEVTGSSVSVGVYIHNLQAMDEAILAQGRVSAVPDELELYASRLAARRQRAVEMPVARTAPPPQPGQAARFEQLARDAEANGKPTVAKLHWQMAAKHGSTFATAKLSERANQLGDRNARQPR